MKKNRIRTVMPGAPGTKKLMKKYGDNLLLVRYRYNAETKECIKTAEIIEKRNAWNPDNKNHIPNNKILPIKVEYGEIQIGRLVRKAGGVWNREKKVWEIRYDQIKSLGLTERIVEK